VNGLSVDTQVDSKVEIQQMAQESDPELLDRDSADDSGKVFFFFFNFLMHNQQMFPRG
jgi:hypothetical protein